MTGMSSLEEEAMREMDAVDHTGGTPWQKAFIHLTTAIGKAFKMIDIMKEMKNNGATNSLLFEAGYLEASLLLPSIDMNLNCAMDYQKGGKIDDCDTRFY